MLKELDPTLDLLLGAVLDADHVEAERLELGADCTGIVDRVSECGDPLVGAIADDEGDPALGRAGGGSLGCGRTRAEREPYAREKKERNAPPCALLRAATEQRRHSAILQL